MVHTPGQEASRRLHENLTVRRVLLINHDVVRQVQTPDLDRIRPRSKLFVCVELAYNAIQTSSAKDILHSEQLQHTLPDGVRKWLEDIQSDIRHRKAVIDAG